MAEQEAIIKDFEATRDKYLELFRRIVELKIPGVIDPVAATCEVGEVCHGGTFATPLRQRERPPRK